MFDWHSSPRWQDPTRLKQNKQSPFCLRRACFCLRNIRCSTRSELKGSPAKWATLLASCSASTADFCELNRSGRLVAQHRRFPPRRWRLTPPTSASPETKHEVAGRRTKLKQALSTQRKHEQPSERRAQKRRKWCANADWPQLGRRLRSNGLSAGRSISTPPRSKRLSWRCHLAALSKSLQTSTTTKGFIVCKPRSRNKPTWPARRRRRLAPRGRPFSCPLRGIQCSWPA